MSSSEDEFQECVEEGKKEEQQEEGGGGRGTTIVNRVNPAVDAVLLQETLDGCTQPPRPCLPQPRAKGASGLWGAIKSAIGKDITKIAMPVQFNEPISFLQRLAEDLEYSEVLDAAAREPDPLIRLAYVAAFASSCYVSYSKGGLRIYKAFNPLLGETYELVRPDKGVRAICEQVSHHPPISTMYAESTRGWSFSEDYSAIVKFRGTIKLQPTGIASVTLGDSDHGERYTWTKPKTTAHNILFGTLWVDQEGDVPVTVHGGKGEGAGASCTMHWRSYSDEGKSYRTLTGKLRSGDGVVKYTLHGAWDQGLCLLSGDVDKRDLPSPKAALSAPAARVLWRATPQPDQDKSYYGMPVFAQSLNQPLPNVCPSDSRLRPDQRALEDGLFSGATDEKLRLEKKQRARRKQREAGEIPPYKPRWFRQNSEGDASMPGNVYQGDYWTAKRDQSFEDPDVF
eukprot:UC1_evm2s1907